MNSLIVSDKEKYGEDSPSVCCPSGPGEKPKPEDRKSAPTFDLVGPQVAALDMDNDAAVGKVYVAKVKLIVKAVSDGDKYDSSVTEAGKRKKPKTVTVQLIAAAPIPEGDPAHEDEETPAEEAGEMAAEGKGEEEEEADEPAAGEASETPAEEGAEEAGEPAAGEKAEKPAKGRKKAKESEKTDYVSPAEADLPE